MKFDIWKVTKSIVLVLFILFVFFNFNNFLNKFNQAPPQQPQIIKIEDNALLIRLAASDQRVKELEIELKDQKSLILKYAKENKEKIDEIGIVKSKLEQTVKLHQASSHVYLKGKVTDHHFIKIYKKAANGTQFPVAWAMFYPNQPDSNKLWKTGTYPLEFNVDVIETENKEGMFNRYVELNIENNQMKETKGYKYPLKITKLDWAKSEKNDKSFYLWNPRLGIGGLATNDFAAPKLDISLSSYGKTKRDMDWRFIALGVGYSNYESDNKDFIFEFSPAQWNFGNVVPLIENAFIGPSIGWVIPGNTSFGFSISVPF